eukprot:4921586-Pleurochrysis_carterae.AAC.1
MSQEIDRNEADFYTLHACPSDYTKQKQATVKMHLTLVHDMSESNRRMLTLSPKAGKALLRQFYGDAHAPRLVRIIDGGPLAQPKAG